MHRGKRLKDAQQARSMLGGKEIMTNSPLKGGCSEPGLDASYCKKGEEKNSQIFRKPVDLKGVGELARSAT